MDQRWVKEEQLLWDLLHAKPKIADNKKNAKIVAKAKLKGKKVPGMMTEEEAVAKSWVIYEKWIKH